MIPGPNSPEPAAVGVGVGDALVAGCLAGSP